MVARFGILVKVLFSGGSSTNGAPLPDWKEAALQLLRAKTGQLDEGFPCIPSDTQSWTEDDRAIAVSFLEAIHEPVAEGVLNEVSNPLDARSLVLVRTWSGSSEVVVPLLVGAEDETEIIRAIRQHEPKEFMGLLAKTNAGRHLALEDQSPVLVCVITSSGRSLSIGRSLSGTTISWGRSTRYFWLSDQERRDAIAAIVDPEKYRGSFVWGLEKSQRWPEDARTRVIGFIEKVPKTAPFY
jgi:hypothetical protein